MNGDKSKRITKLEREVASLQKTLNTPAQVRPSSANSNQSKKPWYKTVASWKSLLELVGIPFAIGYAIVTFFQWQDLRHNFKVDERAWVNLRNEMAESQRIDLPPDGQQLSIPIQVSNIGKTPAKDVTVFMSSAYLPIDQSPDFDGAPNAEIGYGSMMPNAPPVVIPIMPKRLILNPEIRNAFLNGSNYLDIYGRITYEDIFDNPHKARFCFFFGSDIAHMKKAAENCVKYNQIEDGQK